MYTYTDYFDVYGRIMQFNKNRQEPVHRWYPFVEGYSKEFIQSIINEIGRKGIVCLEPFSGSGTTALELQNLDIKCFSFEVNPLMYLISKVKLENKYDLKEFENWFNCIIAIRESYEAPNLTTPFSTLYESEKKKKWNYNTEVGVAVEKLKFAINTVSHAKYKDIFLVALASILLDVSNLYRNGKCLSYKKNWDKRLITEQDVFHRFDNKVVKEIFCDVGNSENINTSVNNKSYLFNADSRVGIAKHIEDDSIDLVITSPPYLNSRDYTDTYMLELRTLGFTDTLEEIRNLRSQTLRSHVQLKWSDATVLDNKLANETLEDLSIASKNRKVWNTSIIDMVRLYFVDMQTIFSILYKKLKNDGKVYFNVSNSAYFNVMINTLEICASIADDIGFTVVEIRQARKLKTSPQQQAVVGKLLEGVLVLEKKV